MNILACKYDAAISSGGEVSGRVRGIGFLELWFVPHDGGHKGIAAFVMKWMRPSEACFAHQGGSTGDTWNVHTVPKRHSLSLSLRVQNRPRPGSYFTHLLPSERRCFAKCNATCYFTLCMQRFEARGNISVPFRWEETCFWSQCTTLHCKKNYLVKFTVDFQALWDAFIVPIYFIFHKSITLTDLF